MLHTIDFYLRGSLEVTSLLKKISERKLSDNELYRDDISIKWSIYSRDSTLAVLNGVLSLEEQQNQLIESLHDNTWKLISKLAKCRLIHREHLKAYWP